MELSREALWKAIQIYIHGILLVVSSNTISEI